MIFIYFNEGISVKIAHINETTQKMQTVKEHSEATAKIASDFSIAPLKDFVYNIGLLHDIGKGDWGS